MLKNWLFGKIRTQAVRAGTKELETFVAGLRAMSDREMGALVAISTVIRVNLEAHGVISEDILGDCHRCRAVRPSEQTMGILTGGNPVGFSGTDAARSSTPRQRRSTN